MSSAPSSSRVKRKPPPPFPYSSRYPEPDPNDPFLPLSVLRARAKASNTTLVNPSVESHESHNHNAEGRKTQFLQTPERAATDVARYSPARGTDSDSQPRPWYGLAAGYLSDVSKPLRPPRSRKRPGTRDTTYFSDLDDHAHRFTQALSHAKQQRTMATSEATPNENGDSVQYNPDTQYHYRRRSQSVLLPPSRRASTAAHGLASKPNASESAQDALTYGDRQSHGYAYADFDGDNLYMHAGHEHTPSGETESLRSRMDSEASTRSPTMSTGPSESDVLRRHPTPPMTPDDTLSSMSTSPLPDQTFAQQIHPLSSLRDPLDETHVIPIPVPKDDVVLRSNRDTITAYDSNRETIMADPPLTRRCIDVISQYTFISAPSAPEPSPPPSAPQPETELEPEPEEEILPPGRWGMDDGVPMSISPPSSAHPSPVSEEPPLPPPPAHAYQQTERHVESDPENNTHRRRRSRTGSLNEFRKRLQKSAHTSGVRNKVISNPVPVSSSTARRSMVANNGYSRPTTAATEGAPTRSSMPPLAADPPSGLSDTEVGSKQALLSVPKPKKSLSHVNLGLKVLPNASLAPTIGAPSANTSNASVLGNLSIVKSKDEGAENRTMELLRAHTAPVVPRVEPRPEKRRAQTEISHRGRVQGGPEDSEEDLATYSILSRFIIPLSPIIPLASSTPAGTAHMEEVVEDDPPRAPSPFSVEDHVRPLPAPHPARRSMPLPAPPRRDSEQMVHRASTVPPPRTESPVPRVKSAEPRSATQKADIGAVSALSQRYRGPTPLPLSPPSRAKSPIAAQLHGQQYQAEAESHDVTTPTPRALSPVPVPIKSKAVQDVLQMSQREDDERMSQRSRGSRSSRDREDTGYLPVAQLPNRPTTSRQQTGQSQSSSRRSTVSKAHSAQMTTPAYPPAAQTRSDAQARPRAQSPTHAPPRVRSPEPARMPAKVKPLPLKDLDSPLPPPPVEVRPLPADPRTMRTHAAPRRAATAPEVTSPMIFVTPPQLLSPDVPRRQFTEPFGHATDVESPAPTTQSHPDFLYDSEHGRACSAHAPAHVASARRAHDYPPDFDEVGMPTSEQLARAASLDVIAQNGLRMPFGDLFRDRKVVVIFIRHFWCPLCQDYMHSISRTVDIEALKRAGVSLVVIGNGSPAMIKSYRHIFRTPFALYTDPGLRVYNALGMTRRTTDPGPDHEKGEYVRHGVIGGIAMVVRNALRVGMPVWERGGEITQLGGEFVLGPGLSCSFAHRMKTTRGHAPILDVLAAAGVQRYPQSGPHDAEEDPWPMSHHTSTSHGRKSTRPDKRLDCADCVADIPHEAHSGHGASSRRGWDVSGVGVSRDDGEDVEADADADTEDDRNRTSRKLQAQPRTRSNNLKKGVRSYRVTNPDRKQSRASRAPSSSYEKHDMWHPSAAAGIDEFGAKNHEYDAAYLLTHEVLSYTFGNN